ncbi:hypothetical protein K402DRAFT_183819 [Aulographum hederae CBS 113979]|uniref:Uncharacterized protein n=1 Tax=Aulographum hederae CBS 113979 TaxID=1176131 RepID=A0A6G1GQ51_9PEZI|nr:hypothetical protein K402DRAFT_183819 [Aulographum hederae CBS 113979]
MLRHAHLWERYTTLHNPPPASITSSALPFLMKPYSQFTCTESPETRHKSQVASRNRTLALRTLSQELPPSKTAPARSIIARVRRPSKGLSRLGAKACFGATVVVCVCVGVRRTRFGLELGSSSGPGGGLKHLTLHGRLRALCREPNHAARQQHEVSG